MPVKLIAKITPAICNKIDEHILDALKEVGEELGLSISINGGRYGATSYTPKLQLALISEDGEVMSSEAETFKNFAQYYGMKESDLHRKVTINGTRYEIVGLSTRSRKFPVLTKRVKDGRAFKHTKDGVVAALAKEG